MLLVLLVYQILLSLQAVELIQVALHAPHLSLVASINLLRYLGLQKPLILLEHFFDLQVEIC